MNKSDHVDIVAKFDQAEATLINTARLLGAYYQELLNNKIPENLAYDLTKDYHEFLLNLALQTK